MALEWGGIIADCACAKATASAGSLTPPPAFRYGTFLKFATSWQAVGARPNNLKIMKKFGFISYLLCLFLNIGCAQVPEERPQVENPAFDKKLVKLLQFSVPLIGVEELRNIQREVYIFDTREWREYEVSHIEGAKYLGYADFDAKRLQEIPKNAKIVLYCSVGYRSEKIGERLQKMDFENVYNLYGSIFEWANEGYPVVDAKGKTSNKMHTYNKSWSKWLNAEKITKIW